MTRRGFTSRHLKFEFMWPQQATVWYNQRNMHVHYSNTVINILRITKTHMSTCYRPRMGVKRPGRLQIPSARAWPRTHVQLHTPCPWRFFFLGLNWENPNFSLSMHDARVKITRKCALFRTEFTVCVLCSFAIWHVQNEVSARGSLLRKWLYIGNLWCIYFT